MKARIGIDVLPGKKNKHGAVSAKDIAAMSVHLKKSRNCFDHNHVTPVLPIILRWLLANDGFHLALLIHNGYA